MQAVPAFFQQLLHFSVRFANPESDTDSKRNHNSFRCDAVRLLTFLVGIQLAQQLCCHALSALLAALMDD